MDRRTFLKKAALISATSSYLLTQACKSTPPPNIIFVLADDLGYGELGCFGQQKIETPNIDALAEQGMVLTNFYTASPVCAPARCSLLTSLHGGHASIRGNDEWRERGDVWNFLKMEENPELEGQRPIPQNTNTISKLLQKRGYRTAIIGKWGLGAPMTEGVPTKQGFDFFFGYNCQRQAHTYYPKHLWKNERRVFLNNPLIPPHTKLDPGADPSDLNSYQKFSLTDYAPDLMLNKLLQFVKQNQNQPFFLYWATPLPHVPLQAPKHWVEHYVKKFGDEKPYSGDKGYFPCRYPHATYAAMISYFDDQVGRLVQTLKQTGLYENTIIMITSDNGPTYAGGVDAKWFKSCGPLNDDLDRIKGHVYEGGIRVPFIASWPGHIPQGTKSHLPFALYDVFPTLCDISGIAPPKNIDGISFWPLLLGKESDQKKHEYLYWEFVGYGGQQAVRKGRWKGIRKNIQTGNLKIELYDLENDLQERYDVAHQNLQIVAQIEQIMVKEHRVAKNPVFRLEKLDSLVS